MNRIIKKYCFHITILIIGGLLGVLLSPYLWLLFSEHKKTCLEKFQFPQLAEGVVPDETICFIKNSILQFRNEENFCTSDLVQSCVVKTCSLQPSDISGITAQIDLMLSYLSICSKKKQGSPILHNTKSQNISLLLSRWNMLEKMASANDRELELPESFWGEGAPRFMNGPVFFQDKGEEERYKKYMENITKIMQRRNNKRDANHIMQQRKMQFILTVASIYSSSASDIKEIEVLLKKHDIESDISKSIVQQIKNKK